VQASRLLRAKQTPPGPEDPFRDDEAVARVKATVRRDQEEQRPVAQGHSKSRATCHQEHQQRPRVPPQMGKAPRSAKLPPRSFDDGWNRPGHGVTPLNTSWPWARACACQQLLLLSKVLLEEPRPWRYSRKRHGHGHAPVRLPSHWPIAIRKSRQFSSCLLSVKSGLWPTSSTSTARGWWLWWQRYRASSNLDTSQAATRQAEEGQDWRLRLLRCQAHSSRSSPLRGLWY
jgi:hypothetical protein